MSRYVRECYDVSNSRSINSAHVSEDRTYNIRSSPMDNRKGQTNWGSQRDFSTPREINLPPGGHRSFPGVKNPIRSRSLPQYQRGPQVPINSKIPQQQIPVSIENTFTAKNLTQSLSHPRGLVNRITISTSRLNTSKEVINEVQYPNREESEAVNRPLGFDPYIIDQNYPPLGFEKHIKAPNDETFNRPLGFDEYLVPDKSSKHLIGFEQYMQDSSGRNETHDRSPVGATFTQSSISGYPSFDHQSVNYSNRGQSRNIETPKSIRRINVSPRVDKTYTMVPPPSRNYSTYDNDHTSIPNVERVSVHRKKAPRFYSTPTEAGFANEGTNISSVWGQDLDSMRPDQSSSYVDSSLGWSEGVRMDSFNVIRPVTPSPKNIRVPTRLNKSYMPPDVSKRRVPALQKTHTYIQNPFTNLNAPSMQPRAQPAKNSRVRGRTYEMSGVYDINATRSASPSTKPASRIHEVPSPGAGNATFSVGNERTDYNSGSESQEKSLILSKKSKEWNVEPGKDFCTVLEIRTPCGNNPSQPDKPLQLSINVNCADPSMLVTPDKRYKVINHSTAPEVSTHGGTNPLNEVPSDCECE